MKKPSNQRTVSLSQFQENAKAILEEYIGLKYVAAYQEQEFLTAFAHINKELKSYFGQCVQCTVTMTADDVLTFRTMPKRLRLYRGYYEPEKREGISWSLSRKVAEGFGYGTFGDKKEAARVVTGTCLLNRVLAYTNDRGEQEFILDPKNVRDIRNIKVREKPSYPVTAEPLEELLKGKQHGRSDYVAVA